MAGIFGRKGLAASQEEKLAGSSRFCAQGWLGLLFHRLPCSCAWRREGFWLWAGGTAEGTFAVLGGSLEFPLVGAGGSFELGMLDAGNLSMKVYNSQHPLVVLLGGNI